MDPFDRICHGLGLRGKPATTDLKEALVVGIRYARSGGFRGAFLRKGFARRSAYAQSAGNTNIVGLRPDRRRGRGRPCRDQGRRCAICDNARIRAMRFLPAALTYVDWWRACPAAWRAVRRVQLGECGRGDACGAARTQPAFDGMAAVQFFEEGAARIVRAGKTPGKAFNRDGGSCFLQVPPAWLAGAVAAPIPAVAARMPPARLRPRPRTRLRRCRHGGNPLVEALRARPRPDQRARAARTCIHNLQGRFPGKRRVTCLLFASRAHRSTYAPRAPP